MMFTTGFATALLDLILRNVDITGIGDAGGLRGSVTAGNMYVTACTAWPGQTPGQDTSEAAYAGYTRATVARPAGWAAASGGAISPAAAISFGERTDVGSEELSYFIIGDSASGAGTARIWGAFGDPTFGARPFSCNNTTSDTLYVPAHGLSADDRIAFFDHEGGGSLPTGLTEGTVYWVRSGGLTSDEFTVSTTQGGAAVNITALGIGMAVQIKPITVTQNVEPQLKTTTVIRFA